MYELSFNYFKKDTVNNTIERINDRDTNGNKASFMKQQREEYFSDQNLSQYRNTGVYSELNTSGATQSSARGR